MTSEFFNKIVVVVVGRGEKLQIMKLNLNSYFWRLTRVIFLLILCFIFSFFFLLELRRVSAQKPHVGVLSYKVDCAVFLIRGGGELKKGFALLAQGGIQRLIISGVDSEDLKYLLLQESFFKNLTGDVILDMVSKSTYESAEQMKKKWVQELQCKNLMLITSHLHMYRAHRVFLNFFEEGYLIHTLAVKSRSARFSPESYVIETVKSLFYSLWAY